MAKTIQLNVRVSPETIERIERVRKRIQEKHGTTVRVTTGTVFLEALEALEKAYAKLDRDRGRER